MNKLFSKADKLIEKELDKPLKWFSVFLIFTSYGGILSAYALSYLNIEGSTSYLAALITMYLMLCLVYGFLNSVILSVLISKAYLFFKVTIPIKNIIKVLKVAYIPMIPFFLLEIIVFSIRNFSGTDFIQNNLIAIGIAYFIIAPIALILPIWSLILLFRGLKKLSEFSFLQNLGIYLAVSIPLGLIVNQIITNYI